MLKSCIALAGAAAVLAACATAPHAALASAGSARACDGQGGCSAPRPPHQQYYDEHAKRYYYYDANAARYYWEDGAPRY